MTELDMFDLMYDEAVTKQRSGDTETAIEMLRQLLAKKPDYALAHNALSVYYDRQGKLDQAIEHAKLVCEINPDDTFGYTILSTLCIKGGRREEAEDALVKARERMIADRIKAANEYREKNQNEE